MIDLPKMALSLRQPWAFFMLSLPPEHLKRIENRDWNTSFRGEVWVHASKSMTKIEFYEACDLRSRPASRVTCCLDSDALPRGGIVGRWRIVDVALPRGMRRVGRELVPHERKGDRWHMPEKTGLLVEDARAVPFVPCKGALGFFRVPDDVLEKLGDRS